MTFDISSEMPWSAECNTKNSAFWHKITIDFPMTSKKGPFWHFFQLFSITVDCDGMIDSSNEAYWCNEHKAKILALSWGKLLENKKKAKKKFLFWTPFAFSSLLWFFPQTIRDTLNISFCAVNSTDTIQIRKVLAYKKCQMLSVTYHVSPVTFHVSPVACHMSCVTCHKSQVACHLSPITCH